MKTNEILIHARAWMNLETCFLKPKNHILYKFIYIKCPEQKNLYGQKIDWWLHEAWDLGQMGSNC